MNIWSLCQTINPSGNATITLNLLFEFIQLVKYKVCVKESCLHLASPKNLMKTSTGHMVSLSSQSNDMWGKGPRGHRKTIVAYSLGFL